jgi:hypothetical protein
MTRFQDEVVGFLRTQTLEDVRSGGARLHAALDERTAIRAPSAGIVVDVDAGNTCFFRPFLSAAMRGAICLAACLTFGPSGNRKSLIMSRMSNAALEWSGSKPCICARMATV